MSHLPLVRWILLVGIALAPSAFADNPDKARQLHADGLTEFETGHFIEAAHLFERAYQESKKVALLWNVAQAYRRQYDIDGDLTNLKRARALYQNFGDLTTDSAEATEARKQVAEIDRVLTPNTAPVVAAPVVAPPIVTAPVAAPPVVIAPVTPPVVTAPPVVIAPAPVDPPPPLLVEPPKSVDAVPPSHGRWWIVGAVVAFVAVGAAIAVTATVLPNNATPPTTKGGTQMPMFQ